MKLLCIKDGPWLCNGKIAVAIEGPKYMERVTVTRSFETKSGMPVYALAEYPLPDDIGWAQVRFIPLSDIDTTELAAEREGVGV
jgi:hypothetical protein